MNAKIFLRIMTWLMLAWSLLLLGIIGLSLAVGIYEHLFQNAVYAVSALGLSGLFWRLGYKKRSQ